MRQPFIMSSQQYITHGGVTGLQRPLRPLEVRVNRTSTSKGEGCITRDALFHPYILHGSRTLPPHHTHMIYCCNHPFFDLAVRSVSTTWKVDQKESLITGQHQATSNGILARGSAA